MINNAALDVAIGLILMFLMLSLLCSVINEFIANQFNIRSKTLAAALTSLIDDGTLRGQFYKHGLIDGAHAAARTGFQSLWNVLPDRLLDLGRKYTGQTAADGAQHPSYLSGHNVALALIGSLDPSNPVPGVQDITNLIKRLPPESKIRSSLLASVTTAGNDIEKVRDNIAKWFDDAMDRLSGAYKRKIKWISMLVGLLVAIGVNADSFNVAKRLWSDPDLRGSVVAQATSAVQSQDISKISCGTKPADKDKTSGSAQSLDGLLDAVNLTEDCLRPLPIGWLCKADESLVPCVWTYIFGSKAEKSKLTLLQVLGWLLTAAAISLGAPFWFDLLSKFINIRGAGVKPPRQDETPSASRASPTVVTFVAPGGGTP